MAIYRDGYFLGKVSGTDFDPRQFGQPQVNCQRCHRLCFEDRRLGVSHYCDACVQPMVERCVAKYGRLPITGTEFYCMQCESIVLLSLCSPVDGALQRWRCRPCRSAQMAVGNQRRYLPGHVYAGQRKVG